MTDPLARLRAADPLAGELPAALSGPPALPRRRRSRRTLVWANVALLLAVAAHGVDHAFRQPGGLEALTAEVFGGGIAMGLATAGSLALAVLAHRLAAAVAVTAGPWIAVAVVASHFLPHWSAFSDSYAEVGADALSYAFAVLVVLAALAVAGAGAAQLGGRSTISNQ